jgi:hypothetical protein
LFVPSSKQKPILLSLAVIVPSICVMFKIDSAILAGFGQNNRIMPQKSARFPQIHRTIHPCIGTPSKR